ncbi:MAG: hypothetical protein ACMXYG_05195 [Candidatus Woesearchaeota archaeon]
MIRMKALEKEENKLKGLDYLLLVQHGAFLYSTGKYVVLPSISFGQEVDNISYNLHQGIENVMNVVQNIQETVQKLALKNGAEIRAGKRMLEDIALKMEYDINNEMQSNPNEVLIHQLEALNLYRMELNNYFNMSSKSLQDLYHNINQNTISIANVGDYIRPESGIVNYLLNIRENLSKELGAPSGELHKTNQIDLEQEYSNIFGLISDIQRALTQVSNIYLASNQDYNARQDWINNGRSLIEKYQTLQQSNQLLHEMDLVSDNFREQLSEIVHTKVDTIDYMKTKGYDVSEPMSFMVYFIPAIAAAGSLILYDKIVKIERRILNQMSTIVKSVRGVVNKNG